MGDVADAIVIGGGIHGCSTALHLALRGLRPVLIEKDYAGRHASGVNAGGVRQLARHVAEIPLSARSMDLWERIGDLVDDTCGFECHGQVLVAEDEAELDAMRERVAELNLRGFMHEELIDGTELRRLVPAVAETCPGGVVSRRDGAADPARTTQAFRRKAEALGARVFEGLRVDHVAREGRDFVVTAGEKTFRAPILVNAAGAWSGKIAAMLGETVPVEARASVHQAGSDPARAQALLQAVPQRHRDDWRRLSWPCVSRRKRYGARLAQAPAERAHGVGAVPDHAGRDHHPRVGGNRVADA
jgi:sarcosine oxidase subunit beta